MSWWVVKSRLDQHGVRKWGAYNRSNPSPTTWWFRTHAEAFAYAHSRARRWAWILGMFDGSNE